MKLTPLLVGGSLAVNAALFAYYVSRPAAEPAPGIAGAGTAAASGGGDTTSPATRQATGGAAKADAMSKAAAGRTWAQLNQGDLHALAARLRAAGFPHSVVRSIISTQINESFKARRAALMPQAEDRPFWKTEQGYGGTFDPKVYSAMRQLSREQTALVKEIVGENPEQADGVVNENQRRRYGDLSRDKIELLQRIDEDYSELRNEVNLASRGIMLPEDREKLALLEQEKRADLAQMLSPAELEDYLMRTSNTTAQLRRALGTLNASESEFRAIYAAQAAFDEKYSYQNAGGAFTPELMREREEAQKQTYAQIKAALGEQRYADYLRASDREFQQLNRVAQQASLPDSAAIQAFNLRDSVSKESGRIFTDTTLTVDQKRAALKSLADSARVQINAALGPEAGASYIKIADRWLSGLERGAAVTFSETGATRTRLLPRQGGPGGNNPGAPGVAPAGQPLPR
ncbi:MAG TPA: hypothetical protein VHO24_15190 [Opitutaceae bacterium]|nr:hypothetical protein [Opitutaceae bacterium]